MCHLQDSLPKTTWSNKKDVYLWRFYLQTKHFHSSLDQALISCSDWNYLFYFSNEIDWLRIVPHLKIPVSLSSVIEKQFLIAWDIPFEKQ